MHNKMKCNISIKKAVSKVVWKVGSGIQSWYMTYDTNQQIHTNTTAEYKEIRRNTIQYSEAGECGLDIWMVGKRTAPDCFSPQYLLSSSSSSSSISSSPSLSISWSSWLWLSSPCHNCQQQWHWHSTKIEYLHSARNNRYLLVQSLSSNNRWSNFFPIQLHGHFFHHLAPSGFDVSLPFICLLILNTIRLSSTKMKYASSHPFNLLNYNWWPLQWTWDRGNLLSWQEASDRWFNCGRCKLCIRNCQPCNDCNKSNMM